MNSEEHRLALPAGYRLEEYTIDRTLGKGGFGITYLAKDLHLQQQVAIKEHLPDGISTRIDGITVVAQSDLLERDYSWSLKSFVKEARTLAQIQHRNVVKVMRLVEANGTAYMVMEYLEGESFGAYLKRKRTGLTEQDLLNVVLPLLDGLKAVHERGVLHRDIKPGNIYITKDGWPILLDFGSARLDLGQTATMTSMVSHGYSPFEQYQSKARQSAGTDIYAMGGVLYRAITGAKPPMASDRITEDELKPVHKLAAGRYSDGFLRAIDHALSIDLRDRPESVESWREELLGHGCPEEGTSTVLGAGSRGTNPSSQDESAIKQAESSRRSQKGRGKLWALVAVILLALVGIAGGLKSFWPSGPETREVSRQGGSPDEERESNRDSRAQPQPEGWLTVSSVPPGARVFVDGSEVGVTPLNRWSLVPGRHDLELQMADYERIERDAVISSENELALENLMLVHSEAQKRYIPGYREWDLGHARLHAENGDLLAMVVMEEHHDRAGNVIEAAAWERKRQRAIETQSGSLPSSYEKGLRELKKLALGGEPRAAFLVGFIYFLGLVVPVDNTEAFVWYQRAADLEHAWAQAHLGSMYEFGLGVPKSREEAMKWYRLSAEKRRR